MDYSRRSSHDTPQAAGRRYSYQYPIPAADVDPDADYEERRLADFADGAQYDDVADSVSAVGGAGHGQGQGQGQARSYPGSAAGYGYGYGGPNPYFTAVALGAPGTPPFASAPPPPRSSVSWPQYDQDPYANAYGNAYPHAYPLPPPSMASASNSDHTHLTHPISLYPASPASETPPAIFGVHAAHHIPSSQGGHRSSRGYAPGDRLPSFPQWSATWYDGHLSANGHAYTTVKPPSGVSGWEAATMSGGQRSWDAPIGPGMGPGGSPAAYEAYMKEERIKMLERKFGKPKASHRGQDGGEDGAGSKEGEDEEEKEEHDNPDADLPPGSVTSRGTLVLPWRKTVLSLKSGFVLFALAALLCAVLDLVVVKVASTATAGSAAPPAIKSSYTSYVVHAASLFSALGATWLFLFRPCCCDAGRKAAKGGAGAQGGEGGLTQGGMIIPILGGMDGMGMGGGKKNKKKMKKGGQMMPGSPTINLIVDPALLGGGGRRNSRDDDEHSSDSASEDEDEWDALPGEYRRSPRRKRRRGRRSSRGGRGGFLTRLRTQRLHALALRSFAHTLLWLSGICIIILAALCVVLFMSKGKATSCKASTATGAATWCGIWACELAMLFLALFAGVCFVGFGVVGYRSGRRARERLAQA